MTDGGSSRRLAITGTLSAALTGLAVVGVFLVAPEDADQGIIQKIFYFHVAIAIAALLAFGVACVYGIRYLHSRQERFDEISSILIAGQAIEVLVAIPIGLWLGRQWAELFFTRAVDQETFRFQVLVEGRTYVLAALVAVLAAAASALWVRRSLDQLDLIAVLKARE